MSRSNQFQKIYYQYRPAGTIDKYLYHAEEQFREIDIKGKTVLDIGCGNGLLSLWLALVKDAGNIVAIDEYEGIGEDRKNFNAFKKVIEENSISIDLTKLDFLKNNFGSASFDMVVANYTLHHIVRTEKYIHNDTETRNQWIHLFSEIKRILKKDGVLILKEVTRFSLWRFLPLRFRYMDWEIHPTMKEFKYVMQEEGFKNITVRNVVNYKLRYFSNLLEDSPLFSFIVNPNFYLIANNV